MKFFQKMFSLLLPILTLVVIFKSWFSFQLISAGDLIYLSLPTMQSQPFMPYAWMTNQNNGLGGYAVPFLNSQYNQVIMRVISELGWNWLIVERIAQLFPLLIVLLVGSFCLSLFISKKISYITFLIFSLNTYLLMLAGGGQIIVALSYASVPIGFYIFYQSIEKSKEKFTRILLTRSVFFGVVVGIVLMLDLRFAYVLLVLSGLYFLFELLFAKEKLQLIKNTFCIFGLPLFITSLLNAFWLLPLFFVRENPIQQLGAAYNSLNAVQFLSFAKFENTLGLVHPQWPENIFGKTYFMRPEFLILPILAFASLLFIQKSKKNWSMYKLILFFACMGIIGIFLAKGANDPLGSIYLFLFTHLPGFILFRDSTKWYVLIAMSYGILIPFTIINIASFLKTKVFPKINQNIIQNILIVGVCLYVLFLIHPAITGGLKGTFQSNFVPKEYMKLNAILSSEKGFSRILWVPSWERYGYYSYDHPAVNATNLYNATSLSQLLKYLQSPASQNLLQQYSIQYVIVPYDANREIFQKNRIYDEALYKMTIQKLQKIPWLHEVNGFGKIHVFVLNNTKKHFWFLDSKTYANFQQVNMTKYMVHVYNAQKNERIIFTESYDPHWILEINSEKIYSKPFGNVFNSFVLPSSGSYTFTVTFEPQEWINIGIYVSLMSAVAIIACLAVVYLKSSGQKV